MKLGGLFSGIGGFELAWTRLGGEVAWMCEWDKNARKVLEARFPGVPIYPDVRELDPAEVEAVDVLTGGSPCQGFSVAGTRSGLEHGESRLFADYIRIMDGLAKRGLKWALWENVPGVLSIEDEHGNRTFEHVVAALAGGTRPVRLDPERRWNTGLASGRGRAVAWRVLDSRYFGVAQRRRRVFACVAFGDSGEDRAGRALLAVAEGVRGDSAEGVAAGEGAARGVAGRVESSSITGAVTAFRKSSRAQSSEDSETWVDDGVANTVNTFDVGDARTTHAIVEPFCVQGSVEGRSENAGPGGSGWKQGESFTLNTADRHAVTAWSADETGTLQARTHKGLNHENVRDGQAVVQTYGVRRLTPVECERLQAFPDGWTEPAGSDSARYKALGNAVTVNTVGWILRRMKAQG